MATMLDRESRREKILSAIQKEARLKVNLSTGLAIGHFLLSKPCELLRACTAHRMVLVCHDRF